MAGDRLTFTITTTPGTGSWTLVGTGAGTLDQVTYFSAQTDIRSYAVTGSGDNELSALVDRHVGGHMFLAGTISVTTTCMSAPSPPPPPDDTDKLATAQLGITKIVAATSGAAITGATSGAINTALASGADPFTLGPNGFHFNFAADPQATGAASALGYMAPNYDKALLSPAPVESWNAWLDMRGTGWNRASVDLDGAQINITAGLGRKLTPDVVAGIFAGFEHLDYRVPSLPGAVSGGGATIGAYAGGAIVGLDWDATLAGSLLGYQATAGAASSTFGAARILASGGVASDLQWSGIVFEPSARLFVLVESEEAYNDSLGNAHPARSFAVGRASLGGKATYPLALDNGLVMSPYLGLYGDYYVSTDSAAVPAGQPGYWIGDGASLRAVAGASLVLPNGAVLALGSELGGVSADHLMWSVRARLSGEL